MKRTTVLLGIVGGMAAGALLGVLFAPDKGLNTRRKIAKKGEDYVDGVKGKFNEMLDDVNHRLDTLMKEATNMTRRSKAKANSVLEAAMDEN